MLCIAQCLKNRHPPSFMFRLPRHRQTRQKNRASSAECLAGSVQDRRPQSKILPSKAHKTAPGLQNSFGAPKFVKNVERCVTQNYQQQTGLTKVCDSSIASMIA